MTTSADIVNRALAEIGQQQTVTGTLPTFDGSSTGIAAGQLYQAAVNMLLRNEDYEFSKAYVVLTQTAATPVPPWAYQFFYPSDCLRVRQVCPRTWDALDPQAVTWDVQTVVILSVPTRVILSNEGNAGLFYTTSNVTENEWDPMFAEAAVRYIASEMVIAIGGRPDLSEKKLAESGQIMVSGQAKDS